ncbi:MAG: protein kinase [Byssovorax sp.]
MDPGSIVAERFEIERLAGSGGMASVYRARDLRTGEVVALKLTHGAQVMDPERFAREAEVLAELRHPGIVRYVAHGQSALGEAFLAMEWLDGEDLEQRLARAPLSIVEGLSLARLVAEALGAAHRQGIVHRDIKPSNVFLRGGALDRPVLLDFGVARVKRAARTLTLAGTPLGTPNYMPPEQARGSASVDARADLFSLGCVLFECLTGQLAFAGEHAIAVLGKILLEEAPRVSDLVVVPEAIDALLARMLAKDPAARPRDGVAAAEEIGATLARLGPLSVEKQRALRPAPGPEVGLTAREQRIVSAILTGAARRRSPMDGPAGTSGGGPADPLMAALHAQVIAFGGRPAQLEGGELLAIFSPGQGTSLTAAGTLAAAATDLAARAARCALAIHRAIPEVPIALGTGRAIEAERGAAGEVLDRAASLLMAPGAAGAPSIRVDEPTAGLLGARFDVGGDAGGLILRGERDLSVPVRVLLGRPTPCVGRESELRRIEEIFDDCARGGEARAVLITAPAGAGKSRLRLELTERLARRGGPQIWLGQGDPLSAGAPFGLLAEAIRRAAGMVPSEPLAVRRQKLRGWLGRLFRAAKVERIAPFLGELTGAPFDADDNIKLSAARRDPQLMSDQIRWAWEDLLSTECALRPVVLLLEDVQWGDLPTMELIGAALDLLRSRPFLVIAFGRPEVQQVFPDLWASRGVFSMRLGGLSERASERLAREVLGDGVSRETVARLVKRADGNPFYLEELLRAVASGGEEAALPETVLAMVQARLEAQAPEARRLLRAASVFGQSFPRGGLSLLLGADQADGALDAQLRELVQQELIVELREPRFAGEPEHAFRQALVREAAYGSLTADDRALGHRLAAAWLERAGEPEALTLAEHHERGGELAKAVGHYQRAAEQALEAGDLRAARARAERAIAGGASGAQRGALRLIQADAQRWLGENAPAEEKALEAVGLLPRDSALFYAAAGQAGITAAVLGGRERVEAIAGLLASSNGGETVASITAWITASARLSAHLFLMGRGDLGGALLDRVADCAHTVGGLDPKMLALLEQARSTQHLVAGDLGAWLAHRQRAADLLVEAGDLRTACSQRVNAGYGLAELGDYPAAERQIRDALASAEQMGLRGVVTFAKHNLSIVVARLGKLDEAEKLQEESLAEFERQGVLRSVGFARMYLALVHSLRGDLARAEREARAAVEALAKVPPARAAALGMLARVLSQRGSPEAVEMGRQGMDLLRSLGGIDDGESMLRLAWAEALEASGDRAAAREALAEARDRLLTRAAKLSDEERRRGFLDLVPENRRTLDLAAAWGV